MQFFDTTDKTNYRPGIILPFIFNSFEKVM